MAGDVEAESMRLLMESLGMDDTVTVALNNGVPPPRHTKTACQLLAQAASKSMNTIASQNGMALQYGPALGDLQFRHELAKYLTNAYHRHVSRDDLQIVCGATHGMTIVVTTLFKSGTPVFIEDPCYHAGIGLLRDDHHMNTIPVKCDDKGMIVDELEAQIKKTDLRQFEKMNPIFAGMVYVIPVYQNPTGTVLPQDRCRRLVELARKYNLLVFSDDVYNLLNYDVITPHPKPIDFDEPSDSDYASNVLSCGSFSKTFGPGLRLGWIEARGRIINHLKERFGCTYGSGAYQQYLSLVFRELLESGEFHTYKENLRKDMKEIRDFVISLLRDHLPDGCSFTRPGGGFFIWVSLPQDCSADELNKLLIKHKTSVGPGSLFSVGRSFDNCFRMSFAFYDKPVLEAAIKSLCEGMKELIQQKQ